MLVFYSILTKVVSFLLPFYARFSGNKRLIAFVHGRQSNKPVLPDKNLSKRYWFHCASLGEFDQALPLMEKLKKEENCQLIVTFFSPSGYQQQKNFHLAEAVLYMPLDTKSEAKSFVNYLNADVAIFVKYEIWYHHLNALFLNNTPVFLLSAVFRPKQFIFKPYGKWLFNLLPKYTRIFLQDQGSFDLLQKKGLKNIQKSGDTRYDRVKMRALNVNQNIQIESFKNGSKLLVLGSSWQDEELMVSEILNAGALKGLKLMLAPHDVSNEHIQQIQSLYKTHSLKLYTDENQPSTDILILNTIGHLASSYFYADLAFVGGAFRKGLHNILEPLAYGVPVVFGPHFNRYPEAVLAIEFGVAIGIKDAKELKYAIDFFMNRDESSSLELKAKCIDFINWHSGATERVINEMQTLSNQS